MTLSTTFSDPRSHEPPRHGKRKIGRLDTTISLEPVSNLIGWRVVKVTHGLSNFDQKSWRLTFGKALKLYDKACGKELREGMLPITVFEKETEEDGMRVS